MTRPSKRMMVTNPYELDYTLLRKIARECGGFIRSSSQDGDTAEVWHEDTEYVFSGRGLVSFLYALKDDALERLHAAHDLCDYIAKSASQPPSVFVRDAIVARAAAVKEGNVDA